MKQSSNNDKVRVMLVDDQPDRCNRVAEKLSQEGFDVIAQLISAAGLLFQIEQQKPDIILIDLQSPGRDVLDSLSIINHHNPVPVVMYSQEGDSQFIEDAVQAGVTAYLMGDVETSTVKPAINVALAQFKSYQNIRQELDKTRNQLNNLSVVDQAKELLMSQHKTNEDEAHKLLRKLAMDTNQTLPAAAKSVVQILSKS